MSASKYAGVLEDSLELPDRIICTICVGSLTTGAAVASNVCGHVFHEVCVRDWFQKVVGRGGHSSYASADCPNCYQKTFLKNYHRVFLTTEGTCYKFTQEDLDKVRREHAKLQTKYDELEKRVVAGNANKGRVAVGGPTRPTVASTLKIKKEVTTPLPIKPKGAAPKIRLASKVEVPVPTHAKGNPKTVVKQVARKPTDDKASSTVLRPRPGMKTEVEAKAKTEGPSRATTRSTAPKK